MATREREALALCVECYAGYRGEETPRRILFGERSVAVREVLDRWLAPDHRYFKVLGEDDAIYILRHDAARHRWDLSLFQRARSTAEA